MQSFMKPKSFKEIPLTQNQFALVDPEYFNYLNQWKDLLLRHGIKSRLQKNNEKEHVLRNFRKGKIKILVATPVVEVGIDVPNATIMVIEAGERYGLSQLHQLRGRVGRGKQQSYCFLFTESETEAAKKRLEAITTAKNGFELAEKDLALRGPGQFLGKKQTGTPDAAMKSLHDLSLIKEARGSAVKIIKESSELLKYPLLREKVQEFNKEVHME